MFRSTGNKITDYPGIFPIYLLDWAHCQAKMDYGIKKLGDSSFTYFDFWGFKYHLICKIGLKLSTFFDFILSWS